MTGKQKIIAYELALIAWTKSASTGRFERKPTTLEFGLTSQSELWAAECIRRKVTGSRDE